MGTNKLNDDANLDELKAKEKLDGLALNDDELDDVSGGQIVNMARGINVVRNRKQQILSTNGKNL
ncbi:MULTISPECIES: hypothetical protein [unclassified Butyrivibrio]|uniref:hypothetical protein n=1 Tax=unclassified Butyrivibrio TaxID=2639466 RepID=UPI000420F729|nr:MULTISPECIES: hypothetical protein [unclassified Butyrivibrio]